jgi:tricarballylate dehydrogenase
MVFDLIIIGSGNAAICAGISALENITSVLIIEKADEKEWGGNSRYTAGAMRFSYDSKDDLIPLLKNPSDTRLSKTNFGSYTKDKFKSDLEYFNDGLPISNLQNFIVEESLPTVQWLASHNIKFDPIYSRQSFIKDGEYIFWGGLTLEAEGEGDGLVQSELKEYLALGGKIQYNTEALEIIVNDNNITGLSCLTSGGEKIDFSTKAIVLGCGGFEANRELRKKYLGDIFENAKVRGTKHNMGKGIEMALKLGAKLYGNFASCHAVPMDRFMPEYGNLNLPHIERKHYRKISYLFGIMLNVNGDRFVDEGYDFRNYTYAQFGKAVLEQPKGLAWQIFDDKVNHLLYSEYRTADVSVIEHHTLDGLLSKISEINKSNALATIEAFNNSIDSKIAFDPTLKDGRKTSGLKINKTNWANAIDTPPFRAYPVTGGITFTYGGIHTNKRGEVLNEKGEIIKGLFACGEMVGGIFQKGYPGGSGLTAGAIMGRHAGKSAAEFLKNI